MSQNNLQRTAMTEMSIVSISIFTAICLGLMVVLMTRSSFQVGLNPASAASGALLLAILSFVISIDFFLIRIHHPEHTEFAFIGSILYGLGEICMIIGIAMGLKALATAMIAYLFLAIFTFGFIIYNVFRIYKIGLESPVKIRLLMRGFLLLLLASGLIMIWKV